MFSNPLGDDGLKVVLQYLDPHLRYRLSKRIPSICVVEKLAPMRFDSISFNRLQTKVNTTTYRLGLYREYPDGYDIPKNHRDANERGGTHVNLTEHGFEIWHSQTPMSPGDVEILVREDAPLYFEEERVNDQHQLLYERHIAVLERALEIRLERGEDAILGVGDGDARIRGHHLGLTDIDPDQLARIEQRVLDRALPLSAGKIREEILKYRVFLAPYYCRRDNIPPSYTPMIQLTIDSPNGKKMYRHSYNIRLQEAMKKVNTTLFGGRNCVHQLRSLNINEHTMVIRLPVGFRIRIRELSVVAEVPVTCRALQEVVDDTSYPLNVLTGSHDLVFPGNYNNTFVQTARKLIVSPPNAIYNFSIFPMLSSLNNPSVIVARPCWKFPVRKQVRLMGNWIDSEKEVGTMMSYQILGALNVENLLERITRRFGGNRLEERVTVPMKNGNNLEVQCSFLFNPPNRRLEEEWEVTMKVVARQEEGDNSSSWCWMM